MKSTAIIQLKALVVLLLASFTALFFISGNVPAGLTCGALSSITIAGWLQASAPRSLLHLNTLTNLIPDVYAALDVVSRELVGFIPAVSRDTRADRCALAATLRSPVAPVNTAGKDVTPAMAIPAAAYQTIGNKTFTITKARSFPFSWTGEERMNLETGPGFLTIQQDQIAQAFRAAINEIEVDLAVAAKNGGSRGFGPTAGTAPTLAAYSAAAKILDDNGAPMSDRHAVINTTATQALRDTSSLYKVNEAGDGGSLLRQGIMGQLYGFDFRQSAQIQTPTAGTMASATSTSAAFTVGQTVIPLATAGTGVVAAGDIITFANDTNKYVVASVSFAGANPASGDSITLAEPGLRLAQGAATRAITVFAASARNIGFTRNALLLGTRLPALPAEGDLAIHRETIVEPLSGLVFELAVYPGYRMVSYELLIAWGAAAMKSEHIVEILG